MCHFSTNKEVDPHHICTKSNTHKLLMNALLVSTAAVVLTTAVNYSGHL